MSDSEHPAVPMRRVGWLRSWRQLGPPVVILGMHRSGTSVLTEMLMECGIFCGCDLDEHSEPLFVKQANDELLALAGAEWSRVEAYLTRGGDPGFLAEAGAALRRRLDRDLVRRLLGLGRRTGWGVEVPRHWGFKDPRLCVTWGVWERFFPEARLIHILRHPLDVAISIARREPKRRELGLSPQEDALDLGANVRLWRTHVLEARHAGARAGTRYVELRFEDLMHDAEAELRRLLAHAGVDTPAEHIAAAAARADGTRQRRYDAPEFVPHIESLRSEPLAVELGYTD